MNSSLSQIMFAYFKYLYIEIILHVLSSQHQEAKATQ